MLVNKGGNGNYADAALGEKRSDEIQPHCALKVAKHLSKEYIIITLMTDLGLMRRNFIFGRSYKLAECKEALDLLTSNKAAKNGYLPDIDISLSTCYLGNGYLLDREFLNGQSVSMSHFGNNFA
ncbi:MAG: hypothetical protein IKT87_03920, partial [Bacteroidaceae bacterium]|nr:hypothetical protein [Bacteroidaceae bacterium]